MDVDIAIFGSGPSGVSAARAFLDAGLAVTMFDAGKEGSASPPASDYLTMRTTDPAQWHDLVGTNFESLENMDELSSKFRVPRLKYALQGFTERYHVETVNSLVRGSLAVGGLSNVWGAGVSCFDDRDLASFPIRSSELAESYRQIARRIGICGAVDDDLGAFFGRDIPVQRPPGMDENAAQILRRYRRSPEKAARLGIAMGFPRNAVITEALGERLGCASCGQCVRGCARHSIYHAQFDLEALAKRPNFTFVPDIFAETVRIDGGPMIVGRRLADETAVHIHARKVILACGAIGSAAIVRRALGLADPIRLHSNPFAVFALWVPTRLGSAVPEKFFGLSQMSFVLTDPDKEDVFGNLYGSYGLPVSDFVHRAPFGRRSSVKLFKILLPSVMIGMIWLHSKFSRTELQVTRDGRTIVSGTGEPDLAAEFDDARSKISAAFRRYGAWMIPKSFTAGSPAGDSHYAGTVPMKESPDIGDCDRNGAIPGLPDVHVLDGAVLPAIPAKPLTLTLMANADRMARQIAGTVEVRSHAGC